jgi:hypothetical protein
VHTTGEADPRGRRWRRQEVEKSREAAAHTSVREGTG